MEQETGNRNRIPLNLSFFGEGEDNLTPPATGTPPMPPTPPADGAAPKTYTQEELNTREASARKAAADKAQKDLLKTLGLESIEAFNANTELYKQAQANADANKTTAERLEQLVKDAAAKDATIATLNATLKAAEAAAELSKYGVTAAEAKILVPGLMAQVTDEKDFAAVTKEHFTAFPRTSTGKPPAPFLAGAGMGAGSVPPVQTKADYQKMTYAQRVALKEQNPQLYTELSK
jgi:hypothetical protein